MVNNTPGSEREYSQEFLDQMGRGRPKGSRNKRTRHFDEGFQAGVEAVLRGLGNQFTEVGPGSNGKSKKDSKKSDSGFRQRLAGFLSTPEGEYVLSILRPFGLGATFLGGLWLAEEYIRLPIRLEDETVWIDFPPVLHTLLELVKHIIAFIHGSSKYAAGTKKAIQDLGEKERELLHFKEPRNPEEEQRGRALKNTISDIKKWAGL